MKKLLLIPAAVAVAVASSALAPRMASATDGKIWITGAIQDSSCEVVRGSGPGLFINGKGDSPADIRVILPVVAANKLSTSGAVAGQTAFSISVSGCNKSRVSTFFDNTAEISAEGRLLNRDFTSQSAKNVEVQLLNADSGIIDLRAASGLQSAGWATLGGTPAQPGPPVVNANYGGTLNYYARYYATGAAAPGRVAAFVEYTLIYQ